MKMLTILPFSKDRRLKKINILKMGQGTSHTIEKADRFRSSNRDIQCSIAQRLTTWNDVQIALKTYPDLKNHIQSCIRRLFVNEDNSKDLKVDIMSFDELPVSTPKSPSEVIIRRYYHPIIMDYSDLSHYVNLERTNVWIRIHSEEELIGITRFKKLKTIGIILADELDFDPMNKYLDLIPEHRGSTIVTQAVINLVESLTGQVDPFYQQVYQHEMDKFDTIVNILLKNLSPINLGYKEATHFNLEDWNQYDKENFNYLAIVPESQITGIENLYNLFPGSLGFFYDNLFGGRLHVNSQILKSQICNIARHYLPITTLEFYGNLPNQEYMSNFETFVKTTPSITRLIIELDSSPGMQMMAYKIVSENTHINEIRVSTNYFTLAGSAITFQIFLQGLCMAGTRIKIMQAMNLHSGLWLLPQAITCTSQLFNDVTSFNLIIMPGILDLLQTALKVFPRSQYNINVEIAQESGLTQESYTQILKTLSAMTIDHPNIHLTPEIFLH